jgi:hypothetical protein
MDTEHAQPMTKVSVAFEREDYDWCVGRARDLYGRRGIGMYLRSLVREDRRASESAPLNESLLYHDGAPDPQPRPNA